MNKTTILSVENALNWSWSFCLIDMMKKMEYEFIRMRRIPGCKVADDLVKFFDITLLQNLDSINLVKNKKKVVSRIGGFVFTNDIKSDSRYDRALELVGAVIATNKRLFKIAQRTNENSYLIPNGVNLDKFKFNPKKEGRFTVGFAGNIWGKGLDYKGWKYFSDAVDLLFGRVEFKSFLYNHSQIAHNKMPEKFYNQIDCLILPSIGEGCSNVVTEALACGVVVLLTKVGYHGEMLKNKTNCLFINRDVKDIINKILLIKNDIGLKNKLILNGRKFVEKNQDIKKIALLYDKVFKKILGGK